MARCRRRPGCTEPRPSRRPAVFRPSTRVAWPHAHLRDLREAFHSPVGPALRGVGLRGRVIVRLFPHRRPPADDRPVIRSRARSGPCRRDIPNARDPSPAIQGDRRWATNTRFEPDLPSTRASILSGGTGYTCTLAGSSLACFLDNRTSAASALSSTAGRRFKYGVGAGVVAAREHARRGHRASYTHPLRHQTISGALYPGEGAARLMRSPNRAARRDSLAAGSADRQLGLPSPPSNHTVLRQSSSSKR